MPAKVTRASDVEEEEFLRAGVRRMGAAPRQHFFGDVTQTPDYLAAVQQITDQLTKEGQGQTNVQGAILAFGDTFSSLNTQMSTTDAIGAAASYTLGAKSYGAAVDMVSGLVSAAQSGEPPAGLLQSFTGTMIGVLSLVAGTASAGIGAAIMAAASVVISLLQGLFGKPPGASLPGCPNTTYTGQGPSYQVPVPGYGGESNPVYAWPDPYWDAAHRTGVQPGAPLWRKFPVPLGSGSPSAAADFAWYSPVPMPQGSLVSRWPAALAWQPANSSKPLKLFFCAPSTDLGQPSAPGFRFIDAAFPLYHQMECETAAADTLFAFIGAQAGATQTTVQALKRFNAAFFTALRLNWEYALNGITPPASDLQVLVHTIYTWNNAHDAGDGWDIQPDATSQPWMPNGTACAGVPPWYAAILASGAGAAKWPDGVTKGSNLHINTGTAKPFSLKAQGIHIAKTSPPASRGTSAAAKVALGTAGAAGAGLLAAFIVAQVEQTTTQRVLKRAWRGTKNGTARVYRRLRRAF